MTFQSNLSTSKQDFYNIAGFSSVPGAMDCTHIPIVSPGEDSAEVYRNRKNFFSINIQAICNTYRNFINVVAQWCGSTHGSRIYENSVIRDRFENNEVNGYFWGTTVSQTLFGNPKGPVELGNPNTCAETKLCLNFILFRLKK